MNEEYIWANAHTAIKAALEQPTKTLCAGRHELPIRVYTGALDNRNQALKIDRLLNYAQHVAVLGMHASGHHPDRAVQLASNGSIGAYQGSVDSFDRWRGAVKLKGDRVLGTTLPDGSEWVIWVKDRLCFGRRVGVAMGWDLDALELCRLEDVLDRQVAPNIVH